MQNIKLVVIGPGGAGKTSMLITYTTNEFPAEYVPSIFDNYAADVMVDKKPIHLGLWDTGGRSIEYIERFRPLSYPQTDVFLLCFSVADDPNEAGREMQKLVEEVRSHVPGVPYVLVALKKDLRDDAESIAQLKAKGREMITKEQGEKMARQLGAAEYHEVSSLRKEGLNTLFEDSIRAVFSRKLSMPGGKKGSTLKSLWKSTVGGLFRRK